MSETDFENTALDVFVTTSGYIGVMSSQLDAASEQDVFGASGLLPPKPLTLLVETMVAATSSFPDSTDLSDLKACQLQLEASLQIIQNRLSSLSQ